MREWARIKDLLTTITENCVIRISGAPLTIQRWTGTVQYEFDVEFEEAMVFQ